MDEQRYRLEKKAGYFKWMLDEYVGNVYVCDMETYELLYMNQNACETLGTPMKKLIGRKCYEVIQGRTSPCPFCTNDRITEDEFYEWEFFNPVLDHKFMIKNRVIDWEGHRARLELSHDNDSLEYKLAKKNRERSAILRTIPGGFARLDARDMRTVLWYGGDFLRLIGYTEDQFVNELDSQCTYVHPDDLERAISVMLDSKVTGEDTTLETRIITRDNKVRILTMTFSYVSSEESWDGIESFYSVGIDITRDRKEQARQQKALEDACQAAQVASAAKSNFLSSMSHDIRTPMNAIMGMAAIARANLNSPDKVHDCLNKIGTSSKHLLSLINEVLDMSRIESGKIDLALAQVNLPGILQSVMDMCGPLINEKRQHFQVSIGQVRHEEVIADGDRLCQILVNLLSNAIKYTEEEGSIILRINEQYSQVHGKSQYEFTCIDSGIGMSAEYISHIFEPFSRAEDPRISKLQGTGLGMTITENVVRMMNGTIQVESELGKGSKFTVSVPMEWCEQEESCSDELLGQPVLVVDDDQITCENAAALLNELGMRGYWVMSGREAIRCITEAHDRKDDFFAVILDWIMPEMNGLETVRVIRGKLGDDVPIIIISAYDYSDIEEEFISAGADAFITKPLFKSRMLQVLQLFISSGESGTAHTTDEKRNPVFSGKRILLAEDNEVNREIVIELLRVHNIDVDAAENGQEALEMFEASEPGTYHAILMDIQMPVLNGYDTTAGIRSLKRGDAQSIPIIALTADAFAADIARSRKAGMNDHIAKPVDVNYLLETLEEWMC
ncbi:response regulator [Ruminococcus sp. OA3]|uniref:PAS domain-containing hybrid sensor histidine kinase/response regulator n=1 Tax=Ruminococcus sp. OA3 TaxID=2914164 RepID=UPI001F0654FC|nr:PAS domain-containing hybrid sensor histidine kinase/response regulator [Ruminococcus sp. OA3]MCH1983252.1 response regulator [Ruminococcus sp. OA3]